MGPPQEIDEAGSLSLSSSSASSEPEAEETFPDLPGDKSPPPAAESKHPFSASLELPEGAFWAEHLRHCPPAPRLPFKSQPGLLRDPGSGFAVASVPFSIPADDYDDLMSRVTDARGSIIASHAVPGAPHAGDVDAVLLALVHGLVSRYTGDDFQLLGYVAGQQPPYIVVPVCPRIVLSPNDSLQAAVVAAASALKAVLEPGRVAPFAAVAMGLAITEKVDVPAPRVLLHVGAASLTEAQAASLGVPEFDLCFSLKTVGAGHGTDLIGSCLFDASRITEATASRAGAHLRALIQRAGASEGGWGQLSLAQADLLGPEEIESLDRLQGPTIPACPTEPFTRLFEAKAQEMPNAIAVQSYLSLPVGDEDSPGPSLHSSPATEELTYKLLNVWANKVAHHLWGRGVGPGSTVAIYMERSSLLLVALLGCMKAGCTYVPLDPIYPEERLRNMLEDSKAVAVLTCRRFSGKLPLPCKDLDEEYEEREKAVIVLDDPPFRKTLRYQDERNLPHTPDPESLAYTIFTSGSTGRPKGVCIRHKSLANLLASMVEVAGAGAGDTLCAVTTLCFDIAALELFMPLLVGGKVVIARGEQLADPRQLVTLLYACHATICQATPSLWSILLQSGFAGEPSMRVLCGGEALPRDLARELGSRVGSLINVYGPTETCIWSAAGTVDPTSGTVTVGRPLANTTFYVVDQWGNRMPAGMVGELCIGGDGVSTGYLGRPQLTAAKFNPGPGDLAHWNVGGSEAGTLSCLGRIDHQVKIRGYRVELGEVECAVTSHFFIAGCVAVLAQGPGGPGTEPMLTAYIKPHLNAWNRREELALVTYLEERLPAYMVPVAIVPMPRGLPLMPNGKIDRARLPAVTWNNLVQQQGAAPFREAEGETEVRIRGVWARVLCIDNPTSLSVSAHFLQDSGGTSASSVALLRAIEQEMSCILPGTFILQHPTVSSQAAFFAASEEQYAFRHLRDAEGGGTMSAMSAARPRVLKWLPRLLGAAAAPLPAIRRFTFGGAKCCTANEEYFVTPARPIGKRFVPLTTQDGSFQIVTKLCYRAHWEGAADDHLLRGALKPVLSAFPFLTGRLGVRGGLYLEYGGPSAGVRFTVRHERGEPKKENASHVAGSFAIEAPAWKLAHSAVLTLIHCEMPIHIDPAFIVTVTHRTYPAPAGGTARERTFVNVQWSHSMMDQWAMVQVMEAWATAARGEEIRIRSPAAALRGAEAPRALEEGVASPATDDGQEPQRLVQLMMAGSPRLVQPTGRTRLGSLRFQLTRADLNGLREAMQSPPGASDGDVAAALLWLQLTAGTMHKRSTAVNAGPELGPPPAGLADIEMREVGPFEDIDLTPTPEREAPPGRGGLFARLRGRGGGWDAEGSRPSLMDSSALLMYLVDLRRHIPGLAAGRYQGNLLWATKALDPALDMLRGAADEDAIWRMVAAGAQSGGADAGASPLVDAIRRIREGIGFGTEEVMEEKGVCFASIPAYLEGDEGLRARPLILANDLSTHPGVFDFGPAGGPAVYNSLDDHSTSRSRFHFECLTLEEVGVPTLRPFAAAKGWEKLRRGRRWIATFTRVHPPPGSGAEGGLVVNLLNGAHPLVDLH